MKILVVGSINMDLTTYVDKLPLQGETKFGNSFIQCPGGKGANQAVASSLAGGDVTMLGAIGNDANGISLKNILENKGVKLKCEYEEYEKEVLSCISYFRLIKAYLIMIYLRLLMNAQIIFH